MAFLHRFETTSGRSRHMRPFELPGAGMMSTPPSIPSTTPSAAPPTPAQLMATMLSQFWNDSAASPMNGSRASMPISSAHRAEAGVTGVDGSDNHWLGLVGRFERVTATDDKG